MGWFSRTFGVSTDEVLGAASVLFPVLYAGNAVAGGAAYSAARGDGAKAGAMQAVARSDQFINGKPRMPEMPEPPSAYTPRSPDAQSRMRRRQQRAQALGFAGNTTLTSPLGIPGAGSAGGGSTLLGS